MKSKLRNIIVADIEFKYWCVWTGYLQIYISPKNDKNCKIALLFKAREPEKPTQHFWRFYAVNAMKKGVKYCLKVAEPQFIGQAISHILSTSESFKQQHKTVIYSAWDLLSDMGYESAVPDWKVEW